MFEAMRDLRVRLLVFGSLLNLLGCSAAYVGQSLGPSTVNIEAPPTAATSAPSLAERNVLVAEADGYSLTVTPDRPTLAPGETVEFTATFHNGTTRPIDVAGPACGGGTTGYVSVALPMQPTGKKWTGIRQTFKDYVLGQGYGPGGVPALDPLQINISGRQCGDWAISSELGAGESVTSSMSWKAEIVAGVDPLTGPVPFKISVGYDQQNAPPSRSPNDTGPMASWSPIFKSLQVKGQLEIVGEGRALKGPGEAIDALLSNKKFANWLGKRPSRTWSNANLFLVSWSRREGIMPKGPAWEIDLFREMGVPRHWAIAFVDPFDASLISVTYCNIPCDR
jgi:hypothetical protein